MIHKRSALILLFICVFTVFFASIIYFKTGSGKKNSVSGEIFEVKLGSNGFTPSELSIKPGETVKFTTDLGKPFWPASDLHPTHGIYPEFDPQEPIEPTDSWSFTFLKAGRWRYHDHLQPEFRGIIEVK